MLCFIDIIHSSNLEKKSVQLSMELAQAKKMICTAESELDELKSAAQEQKAKEERLQCQLQEKKEEISGLEQGHDAKIRLERNETYRV